MVLAVVLVNLSSRLCGAISYTRRRFVAYQAVAIVVLAMGAWLAAAAALVSLPLGFLLRALPYKFRVTEIPLIISSDLRDSGFRRRHIHLLNSRRRLDLRFGLPLHLPHQPRSHRTWSPTSPTRASLEAASSSQVGSDATTEVQSLEAAALQQLLRSCGLLTSGLLRVGHFFIAVSKLEENGTDSSIPFLQRDFHRPLSLDRDPGSNHPRPLPRRSSIHQLLRLQQHARQLWRNLRALEFATLWVRLSDTPSPWTLLSSRPSFGSQSHPRLSTSSLRSDTCLSKRMELRYW